MAYFCLHCIHSCGPCKALRTVYAHGKCYVSVSCRFQPHSRLPQPPEGRVVVRVPCSSFTGSGDGRGTGTSVSSRLSCLWLLTSGSFLCDSEQRQPTKGGGVHGPGHTAD